MHPDILRQLAADHIREMHAKAGHQRLVRRTEASRVRALLSR